MRLLILHRCILRELVATFLFAVTGFTFVFLAALIYQLSRNGMPPGYLAKFLPCLIPSAAVYTLPMGCLFAATLAYSRLAADQELQAAQWSGVRLWTCAAPAILLGAVVSLGCAVLNDRAVPAANQRQREFREEIARELPLVLAAMTEPIYGTDTQKMYINAVEGDVFRGVTVMETVNSVTTRILNAREALVHYDREHKTMRFELAGGTMEDFDPGPPPRLMNQVEFLTCPLPIAFDPALDIWKDWKAKTRREILEALRRRRAGERVEESGPTYSVGEQSLYLGDLRGDRATHMILAEKRADGSAHVIRADWADLAIRIEQSRIDLDLGPGRDQEVEALARPWKVVGQAAFPAGLRISLPLDPQAAGLATGLEPSSEDIRNAFRARVLEGQRLWYEAKVEIQERMSSALLALCFTAIGVPLGIWLRHGNRLVSFGASLLVVFCLYVPAQAAGKQMSLSGRLPAPVGLWMPDAVLLAASLVFWRKVRS